jgi:uncharacterized protein
VTLDDKLVRLRATLDELDSALVAFSGGVDSTFLLRVASDVLGGRCVALTTVSPTTPDDDLAQAKAAAASFGVEHVVVDTNELEIPGYAENPVNRCWFCKDNLFVICTAEAARRGIAAVLDGANLDDLGDHRPGLAAAGQQGVRHPLIEAGFAKADVRAASRDLALSTWDRPASPCLSSRFPYGTRITPERLRQVAEAERAIRGEGVRELRVRWHEGGVARIEVAADDMPRLVARRAVIVAALRAAGFSYVTLDLTGFRSGSLNEVLGPRKHEGPEDTPPAPRLR